MLNDFRQKAGVKAKNIGGLGFGYWYRLGTRKTVEASYAVDVYHLNRINGFFESRACTHSTLSWRRHATTRRSRSHCWLLLLGTLHHAELYRNSRDGPHDYTYPISVMQVPCIYGGTVRISSVLATISQRARRATGASRSCIYHQAVTTFCAVTATT